MSDSPLTEKPYAEDLPSSTGASVVLNGHYLPPPQDKDGRIWVRSSVLILKDAQTLYAMWRDIEFAPQWQEHIVDVVLTGPTTSRWSMKTLNDDDAKVISWESEVLADEPGVRIAWRSTGAEFDNAGEVIFEAAPGGQGTVVTMLQEFRMGKLASAWETLVGRNPKQAVIEDLRHFKALAETGEIPRSQLDPHGDRGIIGNFKRSSYGETVPTPTGGN